MRYFFAILIFLIISSTELTGQEGSKIDLNNVNVGTKRLPTIFLFGEEYTSRDRNELIRGILRSQFYRESLKIVINLEEFTSKREFSNLVCGNFYKHTHFRMVQNFVSSSEILIRIFNRDLVIEILKKFSIQFFFNSFQKVTPLD